MPGPEDIFNYALGIGNDVAHFIGQRILPTVSSDQARRNAIDGLARPMMDAVDADAGLARPYEAPGIDRDNVQRHLDAQPDNDARLAFIMAHGRFMRSDSGMMRIQPGAAAPEYDVTGMLAEVADDHSVTDFTHYPIQSSAAPEAPRDKG